MLRDRRVSFYGNINIPSHITLQELNHNYHATVLAYGASQDRALNIPGEILVTPASSVVGWYNGHPEEFDTTFHLSSMQSAVEDAVHCNPHSLQENSENYAHFLIQTFT